MLKKKIAGLEKISACSLQAELHQLVFLFNYVVHQILHKVSFVLEIGIEAPSGYTCILDYHIYGY